MKQLPIGRQSFEDLRKGDAQFDLLLNGTTKLRTVTPKHGMQLLNLLINS
jgi:hypothetical protein